MTVNPNTSVTGTPFIPTVRPGAVDSAAARETSAEAASTALPVDSKAPPAEKRPTLLEAAGRGAIQTGKAWAQEVGTVTSGVGGLGLMTLGLYGGVIGGALAGSILGGGFAGPVAAALSQGGAWNFLSTGLSTRRGWSWEAWPARPVDGVLEPSWARWQASPCPSCSGWLPAP